MVVCAEAAEPCSTPASLLPCPIMEMRAYMTLSPPHLLRLALACTGLTKEAAVVAVALGPHHSHPVVPS
ncbi:hypothetical protein FHG87_007657 [Trinorchestia longiramus]|nr:hypothetical protein FHG87_007657 [Trinorchestia longiramus]